MQTGIQAASTHHDRTECLFMLLHGLVSFTQGHVHVDSTGGGSTPFQLPPDKPKHELHKSLFRSRFPEGTVP